MMMPSSIHTYFVRIGLDPSLGWEILETGLENPCNDVRDANHLRSLLASYTVIYIDMAWDDEDRVDGQLSSLYTTYVEPLLKSNLFLTLDEQRLIVGAAAWMGATPYLAPVRSLVGRNVLPPSEA